MGAVRRHHETPLVTHRPRLRRRRRRPLASKKYGKQVRYAGIHPVAKGEGGGICHIEGPHVHIYAANKLEYRVYADNNVFVGDPVAYGWDGPKYAYKGNHPIQVNAVVDVGAEPHVQYCYIDGPHYHYFEPPRVARLQGRR